MKSIRKGLLMLGCAGLLVSASVMGTMAYLTSQDAVTNTFTVGKVAITLDEAKVDADGKALTGEKAERVKKNSYKLMPGHTYDKDPTVTVKAGSEESYVKMVVTVNKADELDEIFKKHASDFALVAKDDDTLGVVTGYDSSEWVLQGKGGEKEADGNRTYTFYYKEKVSADKTDKALDDLFETITIPGVLTNEEMETLQYKITTVTNTDGTTTTTKTEDPLEITVKAYAIQASGFATADAAWAAFPVDGE